MKESVWAIKKGGTNGRDLKQTTWFDLGIGSRVGQIRFTTAYVDRKKGELRMYYEGWCGSLINVSIQASLPEAGSQKPE